MQAAVACRLLLLAGALRAALSQQLVSTVNELKDEIYTPLPLGPGHAGDACVRLLHAGGTVGCASPTGWQPTKGPLVRLEALRQPVEYPDSAVYLLPPALLADFLLQCRDSPSLAGRVRGVLSEPGPAPAYSQAAAAPLVDFALYANRSYPWNPAGKGLDGLAFPFPIFLLDEGTAENARRRAAYNLEQHLNGALNHAKMRLTMEAAGNSTACLAARTCLPLGGHSVVAALPALPAPAGNSSNSSSGGGSGGSGSGGSNLPTIWVLAQFDTAGLFHEAAVGAESPVSGLIAMLAAAELLGSADASAAAGQYRERYRRRIVFAALGGEPWGLMGSKRLLWEAASGAASVAGFDLTPGGVAAVLEVGPVGRARPTATAGQRSLSEDEGGVSLYAHTPAGGAAAASDVLAALQAAAVNASAMAGLGVSVAPASAALPGLPPTASAGSFVRVLSGSGTNASSSLPAVLLSDYDAAFQGPTFQSSLYDNSSTVDADSIAAAAVVVARTAHTLALGNGSAAGGAADLTVNYTAVQATVQELMQCLMNATRGLGCPIAEAMMTPVNPGHLSHYIGILRSLTADPQTPDANMKSDYERFLWNWLAFATRPKPPSNSSNGGSSGSAGSGEEELQRCQPLNATACPPGFACAGSRSIKGPEGQGFCLNATVRYVPSYSTSLLCDACDGANTNYEFRWKLTDAAAQWERQHGWPADPVWAESNWPNDTPALTLYLKEDPSVEMALLGAGLAVAGTSVAAALCIRLAYHRKLKRH
ncbi:hypothetical protein ABPG75_000425 [Micractinium tetrahymenae]